MLNTRDLIQDLLFGLPLAKEFNDSVAMDLNPYKSVHFLHLIVINLVKRYSHTVVIHSK